MGLHVVSFFSPIERIKTRAQVARVHAECGWWAPEADFADVGQPTAVWQLRRTDRAVSEQNCSLEWPRLSGRGYALRRPCAPLWSQICSSHHSDRRIANITLWCVPKINSAISMVKSAEDAQASPLLWRRGIFARRTTLAPRSDRDSVDFFIVRALDETRAAVLPSQIAGLA